MGRQSAGDAAWTVEPALVHPVGVWRVRLVKAKTDKGCCIVVLIVSRGDGVWVASLVFACLTVLLAGGPLDGVMSRPSMAPGATHAPSARPGTHARRVASTRPLAPLRPAPCSSKIYSAPSSTNSSSSDFRLVVRGHRVHEVACPGAELVRSQARTDRHRRRRRAERAVVVVEALLEFKRRRASSRRLV